MKQELFDLVADQTGKIFDPNVLTIVWARRFAGYKRADLIARDAERFERLLNNKDFPVQIIWAGKPYPLDHGAVSTFNWLVHFTRKFQKTLAKTISLPWILGTSEDLRWPTTVGKRPNAITRMVQNHAQKVMLLGPKSKLATKSFLQMMHMTKSPAIIFHPVILLQLLANSVWNRNE